MVNNKGSRKDDPGFRDIKIPVILGEYGAIVNCNPTNQRSFDLLSQFLLNKASSKIFSGGFVFQFYNHANNHGLFKLPSDSSSPLETTTVGGYANLIKQSIVGLNNILNNDELKLVQPEA